MHAKAGGRGGEKQKQKLNYLAHLGWHPIINKLFSRTGAAVMRLYSFLICFLLLIKIHTVIDRVDFYVLEFA